MKFFRALTMAAVAALSAASLAACYEDKATAQTAESTRSAQVQRSMEEAVRQVPAPQITNYQQLRWQTFLYELQDQEIATYSYYSDMDGDLHLICESVGYGMNASIQITSPEREHIARGDFGQYANNALTTLPQPEPNGLYMPEGLAATWVLCSDGEGGIRPVYWEPELIVTPFPLNNVRDIRESTTEG